MQYFKDTFYVKISHIFEHIQLILTELTNSRVFELSCLTGWQEELCRELFYESIGLRGYSMFNNSL